MDITALAGSRSKSLVELAGTAAAGLLGALQYGDAEPALGQLARDGHAGETRTNDGDPGRPVASLVGGLLAALVE